ncbi:MULTISPECIES: BA14K family protein [unclassified Rhizobium]|uniref:BA14K family protein n=1 Tax=unclassified Rhizobium TaxID=2613769 RepID=UPI00167DBDFC|nr:MULTISPECIES: BA14K family protein [unclassified Rhizobium]
MLMNRLAKTLLLTATAAALTLSAIGEASARDRHWRHHNNNDALVGGAVGLATGLIVGSAIANANNGPVYEERRYIDPAYEPDYYEPAPVYRAPARRVYAEEPRYYAPVRTAVEPWTPQWERYCSYRYRSFDPRSGTYIGYDGRSHFCTAGG